jgi:hypothetical protein
VWLQQQTECLVLGVLRIEPTAPAESYSVVSKMGTLGPVFIDGAATFGVYFGLLRVEFAPSLALHGFNNMAPYNVSA